MQDAVRDLVRDGDTVAIEGFTHLICFAAGHEIIRQRKRDLTLSRMTPDVTYDQMIAAGVASKLIFSWLGNPGVGSLHAIRRRVERADPAPLEIEEYSHFGMVCRYMAGAARLPFMPLRSYDESDIPSVNDRIRWLDDPYGGDRIAVVPPLNADVAIIHVGWSDPYGNGQHFGAPFGDRWIARASDRIILVSEHVVPNDLIRKNPFMTSVSYADDVVEAPYGAHPYAAHGSYREDLEHLQEYIAASEANRKGDTKTWEKYLDTYIRKPEDHVAYLERIGLRKLLGLYVAPIVTW